MGDGSRSDGSEPLLAHRVGGGFLLEMRRGGRATNGLGRLSVIDRWFAPSEDQGNPFETAGKGHPLVPILYSRRSRVYAASPVDVRFVMRRIPGIEARRDPRRGWIAIRLASATAAGVGR